MKTKPKISRRYGKGSPKIGILSSKCLLQNQRVLKQKWFALRAGKILKTLNKTNEVNSEILKYKQKMSQKSVSVSKGACNTEWDQSLIPEHKVEEGKKSYTLYSEFQM